MSEPIEYIPKPVQPNTNVPKPTYELKNTTVGKILPSVVIGTKDIRVTVPKAPKSNCKKCYGKGFTGVDNKQKKIFMCPKCYPNAKLNSK